MARRRFSDEADTPDAPKSPDRPAYKALGCLLAAIFSVSVTLFSICIVAVIVISQNRPTPAQPVTAPPTVPTRRADTPASAGRETAPAPRAVVSTAGSFSPP